MTDQSNMAKKPSASRLIGLVFGILLLGGMFLGGCSTVKKQTPLFVYYDAVPYEVYYPMSIGSSWTYEVQEYKDGAPSKQSTLLVRVADIQKGKVILQTGSADLTYLLRPDGVVKAESGNYLLKMPIQAKQNWPLSLAGQAGRATIREVLHTQTVAAGTFQSCILVEEEYPLGPDQTLKTRSIYAPHVGLIHLENILDLEGKEELQESVDLRIYWHPGQDNPDAFPMLPEG